MKKTIFVALLVLGSVGSVGTASAGGQPGSFGVGGELQLSGLGGLSLNFDSGQFHVGGFLGFDDDAGPDNSTVDVGGRFFYHVASTAMSDFSVGGSLGLQSQETAADRLTFMYLEPSFQIRAFLASNVALSFTGGISIGMIDAEDVVITSDLTGAAGVHYYF